MTPEQHNATRGQVLTVAVMDLIREDHRTHNECTVWNLSKRIAAEHDLTIPQRNQLRDRIRIIVDNFESSGVITTRMGYNHRHKVNTKVITLCLATSQK